MTSIDQRVVQMKFDNTDFEKNANSTISVLEKLKEKLTFKDSSKALDEFQAKANKMNFDTLSRSADNLGDVLSTKLIAKMAIVENMFNRITDAGVNMVKSLTIEPVTTGWSKYESKLATTQTIMNATGKSIDEVTSYLDKLMWYSDETSYSFETMASSVGQFTSAGIEIDDAVPSIIGIANAAGLAGASVENASHAMMGFSKAMGQGYMSSNTYEWLKTAQVATEATKRQMIETAEEMGTLKKVGDGLWKTLEGTEVTIGDFTTGLKDKWLTSDVMVAALHKFGDYSEAVYELYQNGMSTADAMDALSGKFAEVGEAGMRASQESKTFSDAINAIKDAVSSGWMKTYSIMFGELDEAKEIWSAVYDELYDIFAAGGEARNELLKEWSDAGGKVVLFKTIADGWNEVKKVMGVVKEAFRDIFPETTWTQLLRFTFALRDFVSQFKLSAEAAYSLKAILKVLLLPIKMVTIGLKAAVLGLALFAQAIFQVTNLLLSMMASAELTKKVFQKLFGETQGERIFNALATIIDNVTRSLGDAINEFNEFRKELSTNDTFLGFVESLRQGLKEFGNGFVELLASGLEAIASGDWKKFFKIIKNGLSDVGKGAQKSLQFLSEFIGKFIDLSKIKLPEFKGFDSFKEFFESIKEFVKNISPFKDAADETGEKGKKLAEIVTSITQAVIDFTKKINPAKILLFGFGVTMLELVHNISGFISSASKVTSSFAGIGDSAKGVLNALKARLDPTTKKAKDFGEVMIKVAAAIAILAGSLKMLSDVNQVRLQITVSVIKDLFITIGAIAGILGVLNLIGTKMKATSDSLDSFAKIMLALTLSALAIAAAVKIMDQTDPEAALIKIGGVMLALVGLSVAVGLLAKGKNEKNFKIAASTIIALAGAVYIMVQAMNKVDPMRAKTGIAAIVVLMGMLDLAFLAMAKTNKESRKAASAALQIAVALEIMAFVVNQLGKMAEQNPERLATGFVVGMIELYGMIVPLLILSRVFGKYIKDATKGYKDLAVSITLLTLPIYLLGNMEEDVLEKGIAAVKNLGKFFTGMTAMLSIVNGLFAGETSGSLVKGLKDFAIACTLLTLPVYLIGVGMDEEQINKGIDAIGVMTIFIMGLQSVASRCKVDKDSRVGIMSFIGVLALFLGAMTILSFVDFNDLLKTAGVMSAALIALGVAMYGASKVEFKKSLGTLVVAGAFVGMVISLFDQTKDIQNPYEVLSKFGGMSMALIALSFSASLLSGKEGDKVDWKEAVANSLLMFVYLSEVVAALNWLESTDDPFALIAKAASISLVIIAVSEAATSINENKTRFDEAVAVLPTIASFVALAGAALLALNNWSRNGSTGADMLWQAVSLSMVIIAISDASKIMSNTKIDMKTAKANALDMVLFVAAATLALVGLSKLTDPEGLLVKATALSEILLVMSGASWIMEKGKYENSIIAKAIAMGAMVLAISGALWIVSEVPTEGILEKTFSMIAILAALVVAVEVLTRFKVDPGSVLSGLISIGEVLLAIAAVFAIIYGIDKYVAGGQLDAVLDRIGIIFEKIGSVFGQFVGGIVNGFGAAATRDAETTGQNIAAFMSHISTALETVKAFDSDAVTLFDNMQQCMDMMLDIIVTPGIGSSDVLDEFGQNLVLFGFKAHTFLNTMSNAKDATNAVASIKTMAEVADLLKTGPFEEMPDLTAFGEQLRSFTPYMNNFLIAISTSGIKPSTVTAATNAAKTMADFAIGLSADGVPEAMRLYSGDGQGVLAKFGAELDAFAPSIASYANTVSAVSDWDSVEKSATAATLVAQFAKKLPHEDGWFQKIGGDTKDLSKFGQELADFAPKFRAYSLIMSAVSDWGAVTKSAKAACKVATLYSEMPVSGGLWGEIRGERKTLTTFGQELSDFAPKFRAYSLIMKEVDTAAVDTATDSVKNVATIYSELPTTGGWMEAILGGTMDLSTFSTHLSNLGHALDQYYADIQYIDFDKFDKSLDATSLVIDLSNELSNFNGTNVAKFTNAIVDLADEGIQEFFNEFLNQRTTIENAGTVLMNYFTGAMRQKQYLMAELGHEFVTDFTGAIVDKTSKSNLDYAGLQIASNIAQACADATTFNKAAEDIITLIGNGLYSKSASLKENVGSLLEEILGTFNNYNRNNEEYSQLYVEVGDKMLMGIVHAFNTGTDVQVKAIVAKVTKSFTTWFKKHDKDFKSIGDNLMKGIANGIEKNTSAEKAIKKKVNSILTSGKKAGDIHSPSRRSEKEIGDPIGEGVAVGIEKNHSAEKAMENTVESVIEVFESAGPEVEKSGENFATEFANGLAEEIGNKDSLDAVRESGEATANAFWEGFESVDFRPWSTIQNGMGPGVAEMQKNMERMAQKVRPWSTIQNGGGPGVAEMASNLERYKKLNEDATKQTTERAEQIIRLYNLYAKRSNNGPSNGMQNAFMLDQYASGYIQTAIAKVSSQKFVAEFGKEFDRLDGLNTVHARATVQAKKKIEQLEKLIEIQTETVNTAEKNYIYALRAYGETAGETASSFVNWAVEDKKLQDYKDQLESVRKEMALNGRKDMTEGVKEFLSMVSGSAERIRKMSGDESNELVEMFDALQEDIADGILNNPVIINAIQEKMSDILSIFDDMVSSNELGYEIEDLEYQLWAKTFGLDATDVEQMEAQQELLNKKIASQAETYAIRKAAYEEAMALGADQTTIDELYAEMLRAQIELADLGTEAQEIAYNIAKAQKETAKETEEAAEEEEEATEKLKTARERAEEEFEEWRKDGSLDTWHEYGATDEELMEALIAKYEDEIAKEKEAEEKRKKGSTTSTTSTTSTKKEEEEEFKASGEAVANIINAAIAGVDTDKIQSAASAHLAELRKQWADEFAEEEKALAEQVAQANEEASSIISGSGEPTAQYNSSDIKALHKYRNRYTGEEYEQYLTREEAYQWAAIMQARGWDLTEEADWNGGRSEYEADINIQYSNPKGTIDRINSPLEQLKATIEKSKWEQANGPWVSGRHPTEVIDPTALDQYDGKPSMNTLANWQCVLLDPNGNWGIYTIDEAKDLIERGYTLIEDQKKYNYVKGYTGYGSDDLKDILEEGNSWWGDAVQQQYEDNLETDVADSTEKAYTNGVKTGIANANANLSSGSGAGSLSGLDIDVGAIEEQAEAEVEAMFNPEGSWSWLLNNGADTGSSFLDEFWKGIKNGYDKKANDLKKIGIDLPEAPETAEEAADAAMNVVNNGKDMVQSFTGSVIEHFNSVPPIAEEAGTESIKAFNTGASDILEKDVKNGGTLTKAFDKSGKAMGNTFSGALTNTIDAARSGISNTVEEIMMTALKKIESSTEEVVNGIWSKLQTLIQDMLSKISSDNRASTLSITPVVDMDDLQITRKGSINIIGSTTAQSADAVTKQIEEKNKAKTETGSGVNSTVTNNYFTQNNTSPKALSRYDIYRDTKSLLSITRGVTSFLTKGVF